MRRLIATTLLSLGLTGGAAVAAPWHEGARHPVAYHNGAVRGFQRGFERGREARGGELRGTRFERHGSSRRRGVTAGALSRSRVALNAGRSWVELPFIDPR